MTTERPAVCFVSRELYNYLFPDRRERAGGAERQQYLLGRELRERGYRVSAITGQFDDRGSETIDGFEVRKALAPAPCETIREVPSRLLGLFRAMRAVDADVYYVRGSQFLLCLTDLSARLLGSRVVFSVANDLDVDPDHLAERHPLQRRCYRRSLRRATVLAQTTDQQAMLADEFDVSAPVVPAGYELPPASSVLPADQRAFVLWVGRLNHDHKRPDRFLDLAAALPDREFCMVAAPGPDEAYNRTIRERAATLDNLRFEGYVPPDEIHDYYRRAALVVNTSETEGFGNVFLEAWRVGTPVVSLKFTLDGLIPERNIGRHAGSMDRLVRDVTTLADDPVLRERLGSNCRDLMREKFEISRVVDQFEDAVFGDERHRGNTAEERSKA
jgi:glycosyltransferase involved in cell wall biosynthesis